MVGRADLIYKRVDLAVVRGWEFDESRQVFTRPWLLGDVLMALGAVLVFVAFLAALVI